MSTATEEPPKKTGLNSAAYTIALAGALARHCVRAPLFNVLNATAWKQARDGHATIPGLVLMLGITFQAICQMMAKHPDLITATQRGPGLRQVTLTPAITPPASP
jgi:hypothetical protein